MKSFAEYIRVDWTEHETALPTGITMAWTCCGPDDGIPLVLIHGVTDGRISWAQVAPMLAGRGYRVYVPEYRGNGKTDKPDPGPCGYTIQMHTDDILAWMDAIGLEKAHVAGHSLGSLICQRLNITAPDRILSTTLQDSAARCTENAVISWVLSGDGEEYLGVRGYDDAEQLPEHFLAGWTENTNDCEDFHLATLEHVRQIPYPAWNWLMTGLAAYDNRGDLPKMTGKVLVLWGDNDTVFPRQDQEELRAGLTECDVVWNTLSGGSHNFHWDGPKERLWFVDAVDAFIRRL